MDANSGTHRRARVGRARRSSGSTALVVGGTTLALLLCGCSDTGDAVGTQPTASASTAAATDPPTASASSDATAWQDRFTDQQIASYESALLRWQEYSAKTAQIYRVGRDTETARDVFREYDMQAPARIRSLAETYEAQGLRTLRGPAPLSTTPVTVDDDVVVISQCNDYTDIEVIQNGEPVDGAKPDHLQTPLRIEMNKPAGHDWMVARVQLKDDKSCAA